MAESNRVVSRLMSFILLFDCQEAFHCCLVVACSNRINMISIQCHRVGEWSAGKPECGNCIVPVWGNHDYAGLNEVAIPFNITGKLDGRLQSVGGLTRIKISEQFTMTACTKQNKQDNKKIYIYIIKVIRPYVIPRLIKSR